MNRAFHLLAALLVILIVALLVTVTKGFRYAYEPAESNVLNHYRASPQTWELWGKPLTDGEAARLQVSARTGGVKVDAALLRLGRSAFYKETFRNEVFLTDVMGILAGPLRLTNVVKAILALHGEGTTNLRVEVPETVTIGGRTFAKGAYFDTGLDVARGSFAPLGMATVIRGAKIRVGITCAACHATVDPQTKKVIEGAPNQDLNAGLLLALGTNSVPYFMHTDVNPLLSVSPDMDRQVASTTGTRVPLPKVVDLENKVDEALLQWPPGNFDSLTDLRADPTQLPGSFTWGNHPYGWSGNFIAGPFRGLSAQNNNVHALNSDSLLLAAASGPLFDIDPEVYVAILLQNAASKAFRYDPRNDGTPSAFLAARRSTPGSPGINEVVLSASWPKGTLLTPDGTLTSSPGYPVWQQNNAMSAWQNTLVPPPAPFRTDESTKLLGHDVFRRAGCERCHAGDFLTTTSSFPHPKLVLNRFVPRLCRSPNGTSRRP
ncbi:MAG: hypothetical protein JWN34_4149 [Bryobacterales bacterium]|nr:hypothetical protein [Bryobacterales bacterium]